MRILWAVIIGLLTLALLMAGGLGALQGTVVIMGLPFSVVLFFMMFGLFSALKTETLKHGMSPMHGMPTAAEGKSLSWRQRLARAMSFPDRKGALKFMDETVRPAMEEIRDELRNKGVAADIQRDKDEPHLSLDVDLGNDGHFTYQVWPRSVPMPAFAIRPHSETSTYYRLEVHLINGGQGYDLMDYGRSQIIEDILDQYERHLAYLQRLREAPGDVSMPGLGDPVKE